MPAPTGPQFNKVSKGPLCPDCYKGDFYDVEDWHGLQDVHPDNLVSCVNCGKNPRDSLNA